MPNSVRHANWVRLTIWSPFVAPSAYDDRGVRVEGPFNWEHYGACRGDRRRFDSTTPTDVQYAKRECRKCILVQECTAGSLRNPELAGTWGALTAEERAQYRQVMGAG
jgi:hypothetical protein